jgi:hypothetical protein
MLLLFHRLIHPKKTTREGPNGKADLLACYKQRLVCFEPIPERRNNANKTRIYLGNVQAQGSLWMSIEIDLLDHSAMLSTLADEITEVLERNFTLSTDLQSFVTP